MHASRNGLLRPSPETREISPLRFRPNRQTTRVLAYEAGGSKFESCQPRRIEPDVAAGRDPFPERFEPMRARALRLKWAGTGEPKKGDNGEPVVDAEGDPVLDLGELRNRNASNDRSVVAAPRVRDALPVLARSAGCSLATWTPSRRASSR